MDAGDWRGSILRDILRPEGVDVGPNELDTILTAVSADGTTVVGDLYGLTAVLRTYAFKADLGPFVTIILPEEDFAIGQPFEAEVKVVSTSPQSQTVTFPEGLLSSVDETSTLEFEPVDSFVLTKEDPTRSFKVIVTPHTHGTLNLATKAKAVSSKGILNLEAEVPFYISPIQVTLRMKPLQGGKPILNVELDANGKIRDEGGNIIVPKVEVTLENLADKPIRATILGVDPRKRDRSTALDRISTVGTFPMDIPNIVKGFPVKREIDLQINEDGRWEFRASVTGRVLGETRGFDTTGRGAPLAVGDPYPLKMEIRMVRTPDITNFNKGAIFVKPGSSVGFTAKIENVTTNSTAQFLGINAAKTLNALGGKLTTGDGKSVSPPFSHDHELDAGDELTLSGTVRTDADGAPKGTVIWQGLEDIVLVDDATGDEMELTMDDVLVESTVTGWLNDDLAVRVIQDFSNPFPPEKLDYWETRAIWGYGVLKSAEQWTYDNVDAIGGIGRAAGNIAGNPSDLADAYGVSSRVIWEMGESAARTWKGMTPDQRNVFVLSITNEVTRRAALLKEGRVSFVKDDIAAAFTFTSNATYGFFGGMESAYASNDPAQIAEMWGRVHGNIAIEVAAALIPAPKFQEYATATESLRLADNLNAARLITTQETKLRTLVTGLVDSETVLKAWGLGGQQLAEIQRVFDKFKVKGYLRERSPRAFELIDTLKEAVLKPEAMKPKGFSEIDDLIYNYDKGTPPLLGKNGTDPLGMDGITMIFLPDGNDAAITERVAAKLRSDPKWADYPQENIPEAIEACLARAQQRREEFAKFKPKFEEWAADTVVNNGGIPVPRNYADNGIPNPEEFANDKRGFSFELFAPDGGQQVYIPKMKNDLGAFRFISGDIDFVHFTFLDGSPLDPATARQLYDAMFRSTGLQHPETVSWIMKDGMTIFKGKVNQLSEYLTGEKCLLELTGSTKRAVTINQKLTRFVKDGRGHLIFFDGGLKSRSRALVADIQTAYEHFIRLFPDRRGLLPFLEPSKFNEALQLAGGTSGQWTYTTQNNDSLILRTNAAGVYERFDGSKWVPWTAGTAGLTDRRSLQNGVNTSLSPTSSLEEAARAGATRIKVVNLPALWPTELAGRVTQWFTVGQSIIIAPGELTQEVRQITSIQPFTLNTPLSHDHPANTMVAVVPSGITVIAVSDTASILLSTVPDPVRGIVTMIWQSLPGRQYTLETLRPSQPGVWSSVLAELSAWENVLTLEIPIASYDPAAAYRLRSSGTTPPTGEFKITSCTPDLAAGTITLTWSSEPGRRYSVESSPDLTARSWTGASNAVMAAAHITRLTLPLDPLARKQFYRLRDLDVVVTPEPLRMESIQVSPAAQTVTLTWTSIAGTSYTVEYSDSLRPESWIVWTPAVLATGPTSTLALPYDRTVPRRFYRVR